MKQIPLTQGKVALVSDRDYADLMQFKWRVSGGYAIRNLPRENGMRRTESMHRRIMGLAPSDPREVDHRFGNGLDNRRSMIRVCTHAQNQCNQRRGPLKGVTLHVCGKWQAQVKLRGKNKYLGLFDTPEEAQAAYRHHAAKHHGTFANLGNRTS